MTNYRTEQVMIPPEDMILTAYTRYGDLLLGIPCAAVVLALSCFFLVSTLTTGKMKLETAPAKDDNDRDSD